MGWGLDGDVSGNGMKWDGMRWDGWADGWTLTDRQTNYEKNNLSHPDGGWT